MYFTNVLIHPSFLYMYFQGARLYVFFFTVVFSGGLFLDTFFSHLQSLCLTVFREMFFFNMLSHLTLAYESF